MAVLKSLVLIAGMLLAFDSNAAAANPYPNEIAGFKFYERYLAPLSPHNSDEKQVIKVLGSDQGLELKDWKVGAFYSCPKELSDCPHGPLGPLYSIEITPKHRVSLRRFKFPQEFSHSYGSVSEINITCDVYTDRFGLQYWVASGDFPSYKSGDLFRIEYGSAPEKNDGCFEFTHSSARE
jgi:hypothetical protein